MKILTLIAAATLLASCSAKSVQQTSSQGSELGFSLDLFRTALSVSSSDANVSLSPYSAGVALSMLAEGADGQTLVELDNALNGCLFRNVDLGGNDTVTVKSANSVWLDDDFAIRNNYVDHLSKHYDALATTLSFADPATVHAINNWCSEHTEGMIDGIISKLTPDMKMILANALYFKAPWLNPFNPSLTTEGVFHGSKKNTDVSFMNGKIPCRYAEYDGNQMVQLPYEGEKYSMYIFLPSKESGIMNVDQYINEHALREGIQYLADTKVNLSVPKFKVESDMSLVKTLETMGVRTAFSSAADLSGIAHGPLAVSDVLQKTVVEVDEKGSEAAAVTAVVVGLTSARVERTPSMTVDRPFFYLIADMEAERILFCGRVMNL